ncbi:MAG TPA: bifunctional DNA-formamidopyrimidine glycosylase/DNA-(apurinic or apyrimidinic site) lyase [Caldithrix abyssi]|uniref:Formamidopyrimidine-DNA glycosylase n=1 Tax=Caldithrix abyssi TaxID=187145 RepID=A0A7V4WWT5_CALAY|nr:bifunctional DNA-formamidopyrimidine glycosylase/DNA-(apurinic or apyrimidinic site) lyase [Caldithrix abyssi]
MPELPEVETVARELRAQLLNKRIIKLQVLWPKTYIPLSRKEIEGQSILSVGRRGKYLLIHLDKAVLIVHLRMTGQLLFVSDGAADEPGDHIRVIFYFSDDSRLLFRDVRKFGRIWFTDKPESVLKNVGPDALDARVDFTYFFEQLQSRRMNVKAFLLAQRFISGLGNIYTDESLFRAGVHPASVTNAIDKKTARALLSEIRQVLKEALDNMGSTISDYRNPQGKKGNFQNYFTVYSRQGLPCKRCAAIIKKEKMAGRGTHFCPECQKVYV